MHAYSFADREQLVRSLKGGMTMIEGYGPHGVVSAAEIAITLVVIALSMSALLWMAYRTRRG